MQNSICEICGGCVFRGLLEEQYRQNKMADFQKTINLIKNQKPIFDTPIFIPDGSRRRADIAFLYTKKELKLGFKEQQSHNLVDIVNCPMLDSRLNELLPKLRKLLIEICQVKVTVKNKKKKIETQSLREGSVQLLQADNGIDVILNSSVEPALEHRLIIADFVNRNSDICRVSWNTNNTRPETIVEKTSPELHIAGYVTEVPQGVFLQASKASEVVMIEKVLAYLGDVSGKIADLFCGFGTFTYPLAKIKGSEIIAVDSSITSLKGLQNSLNRNQIHNVKVVERNLFKYPFDVSDLKSITALVIDPPRAGAHEQCREIAKIPNKDKPKKIVFVSCNPKTFVYDAELLTNAGYVFNRVTLIDQFVYSKHQELIALFTYNPNHDKGASNND